MAIRFLITVVSLLLVFSLSSASRYHHHAAPAPSNPTPDSVPWEIQQACNATRFPDQCVILLTQSTSLPYDPNPVQIIQSAILLSSVKHKTVQSMLRSIRASSKDNLNRTATVAICLNVLHNSYYRTSLAVDALRHGKLKDARAWMSGASVHQYGCLSGLKFINNTRLIANTITVLDALSGISSTVLSMLRSLDVFGKDTASWKPPMTERDGFWEPSGSGGGSSKGFKVVFPSKLEADATVCKYRTLGCYKTVQEAVNAAPDNDGANKFVIHITGGVYEETVRIPLEKQNVVFLGDGMGKTIITGSLHVGMPGISTYNTATVGVVGDGFMARDLTIQNTAGADAGQASAFRSDSDRSVLENCEFIGNQDTLCALSLRQFYKSCRILGTVDFIFGNSASVFQDCEILVASRPGLQSDNNAITAHGRTDPAQSTGFVFQNCFINGTEEYMAEFYSNPGLHKTFLGRPWKEYSRTVFINCDMEAVINPEGWMPWNGDFALKTLYDAEFQNSGPGSNSSERVDWCSVVPADRVSTYSVENFIQGDQWIPSSKKSNHLNGRRSRVWNWIHH